MTLKSQHLRLVFQACDRDTKGFVTEDDIRAACELFLSEQERKIIFDIFSNEDGITEMDFERFSKRVGKILFPDTPPTEDSPLEKPVEDQETECHIPPKMELLGSVDCQGDMEHLKDTFPVSPFLPMLNSSYLTLDPKPAEEPDSRSPISRPSSAASSRPSSAFSNFTEDTYEGSGEETNFKTSKRRRKTGRDLYKLAKRKCHSEFGSSSSESSPEKSNRQSEKVASKIEELTQKLEEVKEATAQSRLEISSLFDHFLNRSNEKSDDSFFESEKKRKMNEIVRLETELLRLKLDGQMQENEKLRTQNREIWVRIHEIEKEKQDTCEMMSRQKEHVLSVEEKLHSIRTENRELSHQLDSSKLDIKNLEEHLYFLEERRGVELKEFEENKKVFENEKSLLRKEKIRLYEETDQMSARQSELLNQREEMLADRKMIQLEMNRLRTEKEIFYEMRSNYEKKRNDEESVVIEAAAEYRNLMTENGILKESLDQLASERDELVKQLKTSREKENGITVINTEKWLDNFKLEKLEVEMLHLTESLRQKELVIMSLMEVVEKSKKVEKGRRCFLDHHSDLKDICKRMSESVLHLELAVKESRGLLNSTRGKEGSKESELKISKLMGEIENLKKENGGLLLERNQLSQYCGDLVKKCNEAYEKKHPRWRL